VSLQSGTGNFHLCGARSYALAMHDFDFDLLVLGAGSGGVAASRRAAALGARVGLIEAGRVGGTCVLRGCVPKKLLVYGSHFRDDLEDAAGFGWSVSGASLDWSKLVAAKDREVNRLNGVYLKMLADSGVHLFFGWGQLIDAHTIEIRGEGGSQRLTARYLLIATGSSPFKPAIPGADLGITSDEALSLPGLPRRAVIVGGGYIGVEFAGIFSRAGVEVSQVLRCDNILRGFDEELRAAYATEQKARGIALYPNQTILAVEPTADGGPQALQVRLGDGTHLLTDLVLFATGRRPNTADLGLAEVGVALRGAPDRPRAIVVNPESRTSVENIYAIGDCTDRLNLTPVAIAEGRAVAATLFAGQPTAIDHHNVATAVFGAPPLASVGLSEEQARAHYGEVDVYVSRFRPMKHTLSGRDTRTLIKLIAERGSGRVLGCHMLGADAPEIIQALAVAIRCGATKAQFDATIALHPTAAEEFVLLREPRKPAPAHG